MNTKIKVLEELLPKKSCAYCKHLTLDGPSENFTYDLKCIISGSNITKERICNYFEAENNQITCEFLDSLYISFLENVNNVDYSVYINTIHWKLFKERALIHFSNECSKCGSSNNLEVYHINGNLGRETFNDIDVLCENCLNK